MSGSEILAEEIRFTICTSETEFKILQYHQQNCLLPPIRAEPVVRHQLAKSSLIYLKQLYTQRECWILSFTDFCINRLQSGFVLG